MDTLLFTPGEMLSMYRQAPNKRKQLKIFCECNLLSMDDVTAILISAGCREDEIALGMKRPVRKGSSKHE